MKIIPLRNMLLVRLTPPKPTSKLVVVGPERAAKVAVVEAIGPEVRDVRVGQKVVCNTLVATRVGDQLLLAEEGVLMRV